MGRKKVDLSGQRFGKLVALERVSAGKNERGWKVTGWLCRCDCGGSSFAKTAVLLNGHRKSCGCSRKMIVANAKYGRWRAISPSGSEGPAYSWLCECECGTRKHVKSSGLSYGSSRSCGCLRADRAKEWQSKNFAPETIAFRSSMVARYKRGAKARNIDWLLTPEEAFGIMEMDCHYCGQKPLLRKGDRVSGYGEPVNGIDRVDSSLGYTVENCRPACVFCNMRKGKSSLEDFLVWSRRIATHQGWTSPDPAFNLVDIAKDPSLCWPVM